MPIAFNGHLANHGLTSSVKEATGEYHNISLISKHWSRWWLGAIRHQAITWTMLLHPIVLSGCKYLIMPSIQFLLVKEEALVITFCHLCNKYNIYLHGLETDYLWIGLNYQYPYHYLDSVWMEKIRLDKNLKNKLPVNSSVPLDGNAPMI